MWRVLLSVVAISGCVASEAEPTEPEVLDYGFPTDGSCPAPAGKLTLYAIAPPIELDWTSPNTLLQGVMDSRAAGDALIASGDAVMKRSIGHVNLELDCGDDSIVLTGQTGGGAEWPAATDGAGLLLADTPGAMDHMPTGDPDDMVADIAARKASGKVKMISFTVNQAMCRRIKSFYDEYLETAAYKHYNGAFRPRRMEGAGCAIFGAGLVDVGGLLRRSLFTPEWSRSVMIGSGRIADFLGDGKYTYGGNLVARGEDGTHWLWPKGVAVPVSNTTPIYIFSDVLDAWSGPEDTEFDVPGLTGEMRTKLPFSIYDPEMMSNWAESVWQAAQQHGVATSLGAQWTASTVGNAHEVTFDASCVAPQTIPFTEDHDDLFEDSDAPAR
jgi:hypothetical protein